MTIVCGTDFSDPAFGALLAALSLARLRREGVVLVHALDIPALSEARGDTSKLLTEFFEAEKTRARDRLNEVLARVEHDDLEVTCEVLSGYADLEVVSRASALDASMIVVAAIGVRGGTLFRVGSTAERIAQASRVPVIVVRASAPFESCARGEARMRIVVGVDESDEAAAALKWARAVLPGDAPSVEAAHVHWPPDRADAASSSGGIPLRERHPTLELERRLRLRLGADADTARLPLRIVGGLGRVADHLAEVAAEAQADLLVVGTRQRTGLARLWHGSVSRGVVVRAHSNVAIVPMP